MLGVFTGLLFKDILGLFLRLFFCKLLINPPPIPGGDMFLFSFVTFILELLG